MIGCALYHGAVTHARLRPITHRLRYDIFMMLLDLDALPALAQRLRWFSHDRFNLFAFYEADHGAGEAGGLRRWIDGQLRAAGLGGDGGAIRVLCMPRILGHAFNPISVFFCHRRDDTLAAILYEVNNTFGERHSYLMPVHQASGAIRQACDKRFYVSPFMPMDLKYRFRVSLPGARVSLAITASGPDGPMIATAFGGAHAEITDHALMRVFLRMPLLGAKVLGAIHWEAAQLWWRGLKLQKRPKPPVEHVSVTY